jgi:hypothetical protein
MFSNWRVLILPAAFWLTGCSMSADTALAEAEVPGFHDALASGQFDRLYDNGSDEFKGAATKADLVSLLDSVRNKLGAVTSSTRASWNVNYRTNGTFVTLIYETQFAHGTAVEEFVYQISDNKPQLAGYHISNIKLLTVAHDNSVPSKI